MPERPASSWPPFCSAVRLTRSYPRATLICWPSSEFLLSAALFDHASGLLAITLSAALADWFYLPPIGRLAAQAQGDVVGLALFGAVSAAISFTVETLHRALADLQRASATGRLPSTTSPARTPISRRLEERCGLLLHEFRHRTRNDLHSLVGFLRLRARAAPSEAASEGLREAADHAMALAGRLNSLFKVDAFKVHEMTACPVVPPPNNLRPLKQRRDKLSGRKL